VHYASSGLGWRNSDLGTLFTVVSILSQGPDVFAKQNRFRYFPLGGGAQLCLGQAIVMAEAVTLVARIIQNLQFSEAEDSKIELETGASLRAKGGINRRLSPI